eukprot:8696001-Pyramimonas_sp.AAC.1
MVRSWQAQSRWDGVDRWITDVLWFWGWILRQVFHVDASGKIFNYKKEGTEAITAHTYEEVHAVLKQRETLIHGLGAGGN